MILYKHTYYYSSCEGKTSDSVYYVREKLHDRYELVGLHMGYSVEILAFKAVDEEKLIEELKDRPRMLETMWKWIPKIGAIQAMYNMQEEENRLEVFARELVKGKMRFINQFPIKKR